MNKKTKYLFFFILFNLILGCSFDTKTGIWKGSEEEKMRASEIEERQRSVIDVVKIYSSEDYFKKEISPQKNVVLTSPKKNSSWPMPGLNNQNTTGNFFLNGIKINFLKKKIGKNKFSFFKIDSHPLSYGGNLILADDRGTIFNVTHRGKLNWKINKMRN